MDTNIRLAEEKDLVQLQSVLDSCIKSMHQKGIYIWDENYPGKERLQSDVSQGSLFLIEKQSTIMGMVSLDQKEDPLYQKLSWKKEAPALVVHRLAVGQEYQKQGLAAQLMEYAESMALQQGIRSIRLDVYENSIDAIRFYEKRQFEYRGKICLDYCNKNFDCYEKTLK